MNGWTGTTLRVDLTKGTSLREPTDMAMARAYIGARGMGSKILANEVNPKADALGPANKLIFAPGPLSGTFAPSANRFAVIAKSPQDGTLASSSSEGVFGPALKFAGYDAMIVEGVSPKPVYLWIKNDRVEIRDAAGLWGLNTPDTTDLVREQTDEEASVACIGPAGESLSLAACIANGMHQCIERTGAGAVMGSKNLKAIAVIGTGAVEVDDRKTFKAGAIKAWRKIKARPTSGSTSDSHVSEQVAESIASEDLALALDGAGVCAAAASAEEFADMLTAATGVAYSLEDLLAVGQRIRNNERVWNLNSGQPTAGASLTARRRAVPSDSGASRLEELAR